MSRLLLILCSALYLPACSSIDRIEDLKSHSLSNESSSKRDVVDAIGLPRKIERDESKNLEIWFYTGKPINSSYFIPLPVASVPMSPGLTQVYYTDLGKKNLEDDAPVSLICVFDKNERLIQIYNPTLKNKE